MARKGNTRVVSVEAGTLATFEGTFSAILGLGVAILHSLRTTVDIAGETESVLAGLSFGLATGVVSILLLPLIYFGFGWILGYIHAFIFNAVASTSGGIVLNLKDE